MILSWVAGAGLLLVVDAADPVTAYLQATPPAEREALDSLLLSCRELLSADAASVDATAAVCGERINQWLVAYYHGPTSPSQALYRTIGRIQLFAETYGIVPNPAELAASLDRIEATCRGEPPPSVGPAPGPRDPSASGCASPPPGL